MAVRRKKKRAKGVLRTRSGAKLRVSCKKTKKGRYSCRVKKVLKKGRKSRKSSKRIKRTKAGRFKR